ncbi:MAG: hypothetical protein WAK20_00860 [Candidatus Acidiferrum sp.]
MKLTVAVRVGKSVRDNVDAINGRGWNGETRACAADRSNGAGLVATTADDTSVRDARKRGTELLASAKGVLDGSNGNDKGFLLSIARASRAAFSLR